MHVQTPVHVQSGNVGAADQAADAAKTMEEVKMAKAKRMAAR